MGRSGSGRSEDRIEWRGDRTPGTDGRGWRTRLGRTPAPGLSRQGVGGTGSSVSGLGRDEHPVSHEEVLAPFGVVTREHVLQLDRTFDGQLEVAETQLRPCYPQDLRYGCLEGPPPATLPTSSGLLVQTDLESFPQ